MPASETYYLGIDVGGTNTKVGVVSADGRSLSKVSVPTDPEKGPDAGVESIGIAAKKAIDASGKSLADIRAIGLATPGTMDIPAGMILEPPNLPSWENYPIRQRVADRIGKVTVLQNDANAAAYGEFWVGAGHHAHSMVMWTLGTGIGCGIIIGDVIVEGEHSHGSECGHIIIEMDNGRRCETGQYGTLEAYAGGRSLVQRCEELLNAGNPSVLQKWMDNGEELTPLLMAKAAEEGDKLADDLIMDAARCLGVGTTTLMHTIDPAMVLLGGAMTFGRHDQELGRRFLQRIKDEVKRRAFPVPYARTVIDYATLGSDAGYIGAAGCAKLKYPA
ncbi:MAG: ROK family protein [Planctomycetaceae bacterium]